MEDCMTEYLYDSLWNFTKEHKNMTLSNPRESKVVAILRLFQQESTQNNLYISLDTAMEVEEACQCIRAALAYSF